MKLISSTLTAIALLMVVGIGQVRAGLDQSSIASPGGFIQAGATGDGFGYGIIPGADMHGLFSEPGSDFHEQAFSGAGLASQSASFSGVDITNSATGLVILGQIKMQADNTAPNSSSFPGGRANGGWKDTLTVVPSDPGQNGLSAGLVLNKKTFEFAVFDDRIACVGREHKGHPRFIHHFKSDL